MLTCSTTSIWQMLQFTLMLWLLLTFPFIHFTNFSSVSPRISIPSNTLLTDSLCYRSQNDDVHIFFVYDSYTYRQLEKNAYSLYVYYYSEMNWRQTNDIITVTNSLALLYSDEKLDSQNHFLLDSIRSYDFIGKLVK